MFGLVNRSGTLINGQIRVLFKRWKLQKKPTQDECVAGIHNKQNTRIVIPDGTVTF